METDIAILGFEIGSALISHILTKEILEVALFICIVCIILTIVPLPCEKTIKSCAYFLLNSILLISILYSVYLILFNPTSKFINLQIWGNEIKPVVLLIFSSFSFLCTSKPSDDNY